MSVASHLSSLLQPREWENLYMGRWYSTVKSIGDFTQIESLVREQLDLEFDGRYEILFSWPDRLDDFSLINTNYASEPSSINHASVLFRTRFAGSLCDFRFEFSVGRHDDIREVANRVIEYILTHFSGWKEQRLRRNEHYEYEIARTLSHELRCRARVIVWEDASRDSPVVEVTVGRWHTTREVDYYDIGSQRLIEYLVDLYYQSWRITLDVQESFNQLYSSFAKTKNKHNDKARQLLLAHLSDKQLDEYEESETITCVGNETGNIYRIHPKTQINIEIVDNLSNHSKGKSRACVVPDKSMPIEDHMLGQLLMIEGNENEFLSRVIYW